MTNFASLFKTIIVKLRSQFEVLTVSAKFREEVMSYIWSAAKLTKNLAMQKESIGAKKNWGQKFYFPFDDKQITKAIRSAWPSHLLD
jgi:hypothetical protein